jgi:hypothetical protein
MNGTWRERKCLRWRSAVKSNGTNASKSDVLCAAASNARMHQSRSPNVIASGAKALRVDEAAGGYSIPQRVVKQGATARDKHVGWSDAFK